MTVKKGPQVMFLLLLSLLLTINETALGQRRRPTPTPQPTVKTVPDIEYTISMSKPWTHLLEVEMKVRWEQMPDRPELKMPVWTPGSYLIREYGRHVQDFSVKDGSGKDLAWRKINKNTWQVDAVGAKEIVAAYRVYSNELTVRTNELNDEHAFWNNTALLFYLDGQLSAPSTVKVVPYENWRVATGLRPVAGQSNVFRAANFDILYDSPFEVSDFREVSFDVRGKKHRIVITGEGNYDLNRLATDIGKIIDVCIEIFGEVDYEDYTIIINLRGGGGLEHLNSTAVQVNRFAFSSEARRIAFLDLIAHEYFHVYNVKRIRPDALGPFDYERENYTRLLWVAEGITSYYSRILLLRSGFITPMEFLRSMSSSIQALQNRPGRLETSLEEASFDAWIKYYRQDENSINNQISYYDKGKVVSMMLDATIRASSGGQRSLDDLMRHLYTEFYKKDRNFTPLDFQNAASQVAGADLDDFFAKYVRGKEEIDYDTILRGVGLRMVTRQDNIGSAYLGANLAEENDRLVIRTIPAGTPAYEQGLNTGDQIIAIDGYRANETFLQNYIGERKPEDTVKLSVFRHDRLRDFEIKLGNDTRRSYNILPMQEPSEDQKRLLGQYLGIR